MKNTILKFETVDVEIDVGDSNISKVSDYFTKATDIYDLYNELSDMIETYQISDNDKLERISFEIYGTTDYWDLILMLNDKNPLFEMPYDDGIISEFAKNKINFYKNFVYSHAPLLQQRTDELYDEFILNSISGNEEYRAIYIIKPSRINDFLSLLKNRGYI